MISSCDLTNYNYSQQQRLLPETKAKSARLTFVYLGPQCAPQSGCAWPSLLAGSLHDTFNQHPPSRPARSPGPGPGQPGGLESLPFGAQPVSTVAVTRADIESSVTALGTLQPRRYVDVGAQASGQIHKLHVEVGDTVRKGQLLVEIDPSTSRPGWMPGAIRSTTSRPSWQSSARSTNWPSNSSSASATWPPRHPRRRRANG